MNKLDLDNLQRKNIKNLTPYSSARHEFDGNASIFLDANENSLGSPLGDVFNRYPDPFQWEVKRKLCEIKPVNPEQIFIGNGSDECIDMFFRAFCEPRIDNVIVCPPTYGMFEVSGDINDVEVRKVTLTEDFQLDLPAVTEAIDENTKLIMLCSPNNPTGNLLAVESIQTLLENFSGIVVVDEAYIDFSTKPSWLLELNNYPNLVVLQTLSKAWGLASLRIGFACASPEIITVINKVKPPYNIGSAVQSFVLNVLNQEEKVLQMVQHFMIAREILSLQLSALPFVQKVFPSEANFILIRVTDADSIYHYLISRGIVVRNRSSIPGCENCLRITIGSQDENQVLITTLIKYEKTTATN